jgi:Type II/IV secretion system protein
VPAAGRFLRMAPDVAIVGEVRDREALQRISRHAGWSRKRLMRSGRRGRLHVHAPAGGVPLTGA